MVGAMSTRRARAATRFPALWFWGNFKKDPVGFFDMRAQAFPVIGCNHDQRSVEQLTGLQGRDQLSDGSICGGQGGIVGNGGRSLGIIQMHPHKERLLGVVSEPCTGPSNDLRCRPVHRTALPALRWLKAGVVQSESTVEAGRHPVLWIECNRTDKSSSVISARLKQVGNERQRGHKPGAKLVDPVRLRINAGEYGRVRGHRQRRLGKSLLEYHALAS